MRARLLVAVALLLLSPLAAAQAIPAPVWTEDDLWGFLTPGGGRVEFRVLEKENVTWRNATYEAWRVSSVERLANGTPVETTSVWSRPEDGAVYKETVSRAGEGTRTVVYDVPCQTTPFPLEVGLSWSVSCRGSVEETGERVAVRYNASSPRVENVTAPVGEFATILVERNVTGGLVREHWSADACHWVRKETTYGAIELLAFRCAATGTSAIPGAPTPSTMPTRATPTYGTPIGLPGPSLALVLAGIAALALIARRR